MREGSHTWAFLAVSQGEDAATIDGMLAFGILWLNWTRSRAERRVVEGLRLFVPESRSRFLRERTLALSQAAHVELFEFREPDCSMQLMDRADAGNVDSRLVPIQAVDYWLRVRRHQRDGDFQRQGYFSSVELDPQPPLVWLVAPGLRFHPATDTLLEYLSPEIQVTRIGLNENWRRDLKIVFRQ